MLSFERKPASEEVIHAMCRTLRHRGPDDLGFYSDPQVRLGVRRLSIIDLEQGKQPMTSEDGKLWLVFNGEIYNYSDLRRDLARKGHHFRSKSDTEVILHAFEEWGPDCVHELNGMFAFAIWDSRQRRLMLARDRLGIKPLYYWPGQHELVFGSELKAVTAHPGVPREIDPVALDQFLSLEYIPAPRSILKDVCKLPPAHRLLVENGRTSLEAYWDVAYREPLKSEEESREALLELLDDAVCQQLISDVPLGVLLSGGVDSSSVTAFMQTALGSGVRSFSIGFEDHSYDELSSARSVAAHFSTAHHEKILKPEIGGLVEQLVPHLDEPLADFSLFPTFLVSKLASESVKVVLTGDGGDEIFGGYDTYVAQDAHQYYRWLPSRVRRRSLPALMDRVTPSPTKKGLVNKAKRFVEGAALPEDLQHVRWMIFLNDSQKKALYEPCLRDALNGHHLDGFFRDLFRRAPRQDRLARQQYVDIKTYLADNILTKVDRMSMAASIEARVPLLDHRLVEFAFNLPAKWKLTRGQTKILLRRAMSDRLPEQILKKPKQGFSIPLKHWLCGPLQPLMMDLLSASSLSHSDYFRAGTVTRWIDQHVKGWVNHSHRLWALMVFLIWYENLKKEVPVRV